VLHVALPASKFSDNMLSVTAKGLHLLPGFLDSPLKPPLFSKPLLQFLASLQQLLPESLGRVALDVGTAVSGMCGGRSGSLLWAPQAETLGKRFCTWRVVDLASSLSLSETC